jgi:hypothetical protein
MKNFKRISTILVIFALLGSSGCFFGRGGWGGDHHGDDHGDARDGAHHDGEHHDGEHHD